MMSQKLNREGTVAFEQLEQLQLQLTELQKLSKSDLFRLAKEMSVGSELTPISKSWHMDIARTGYREIVFDGRYFGHFTITLSSMETGSSDNNYRRSLAKLLDGNNVTAQLTRIVHGDDILSWGDTVSNYLCFGTRVVLDNYYSDNPEHSLNVSFTGFKLGLPSQTELFNIVTNAGYKLADNAGNIISAP